MKKKLFNVGVVLFICIVAVWQRILLGRMDKKTGI